MEVLPLILSEEEVLVLPDNVLKKLSELATDKVVAMLFKYLENSKNEQVRKKIMRTFMRPLTVRKDSKSSPVSLKVKTLGDVTYRDIYFEQDRETLAGFRADISSILDNQYAVAWIEPITAKQYKKCLEELEEMANTETDSYAASIIYKLVDRVSKMGYVFKDPPQMKPRATEVTKILNRTSDYRLIIRGIDFLLRQMDENRNPNTWRIL